MDLATFLLGGAVYAEGGTEATASAGSEITTALTTIATNASDTVSDVAPIAIGIMGIFLVWKLGIKMFKSIASK